MCSDLAYAISLLSKGEFTCSDLSFDAVEGWVEISTCKL